MTPEDINEGIKKKKKRLRFYFYWLWCFGGVCSEVAHQGCAEEKSDKIMLLNMRKHHKQCSLHFLE